MTTTWLAWVVLSLFFFFFLLFSVSAGKVPCALFADLAWFGSKEEGLRYCVVSIPLFAARPGTLNPDVCLGTYMDMYGWLLLGELVSYYTVRMIVC